MTSQASKHLELDYSIVLMVIFGLMLDDGVQPDDLLPICMAALEDAQARTRLGQTNESSVLITAALVLDAWHRDRRYVTTRALPKPVRLLGPAPSVEALVRLQRGREDARQVAQLLKTLRLVVPCGQKLYRPTKDVAVVSRRNPLVLQHLAKSLSALLETVGQNVGGSRSVPPLIERVAEVPDLPLKHLLAFRRFTQAQGRTFVRTVNDWLEARRVRGSRRKRSERTVRAGIHTYAYVAPRKINGAKSLAVRSRG